MNSKTLESSERSLQSWIDLASSLGPLDISILAQLLKPRLSEWTMTNPISPKLNPKQLVLLLANDYEEVLYGGAAGGGKSEGLLQSCSQFLDVPRYSAMLMRRTYRDLSLPGALMERSHAWWHNTKAHWDGNNHKWVFPTGSTVQFGYLQHPGDELTYQSAEFQFIGIDEVTQIPENQYEYMFSRLRRLKGSPIPIRMRSGTNPGGPGHEWVRKRFGLPAGITDNPQRLFIAATLEDNPHIDQEAYDRALEQLSEVTRRQLRLGDWTALSTGGKFNPQAFRIVSPGEVPDPRSFAAIIRYWDFAATEKTDSNPDPDWTVGLKIGVRFIPEPDFTIFDIRRARVPAEKVEELFRTTAIQDGPRITQWFERERGSAGKLLVQAYKRLLPPTHTVRGNYVSGDKEVRAMIPAGFANSGQVAIVEGEYVTPFLDECGVFVTKDAHDDQVDAFSGSIEALQKEILLQNNASSVVREY